MVSLELQVGEAEFSLNEKGSATSFCALAANQVVFPNIGQYGKVFFTPVDSIKFKEPLTVKGDGVGIAVTPSASPHRNSAST